jgi:hypothetical protein
VSLAPGGNGTSHSIVAATMIAPAIPRARPCGVDSELKMPGRDRPVRVPAGTPLDLIGRADPREVPAIIRNRLVVNVLSDRALFRGFVRHNQAPDYVLDRGGTFGTELSDEDKGALIEFLKTF